VSRLDLKRNTKTFPSEETGNIARLELGCTRATVRTLPRQPDQKKLYITGKRKICEMDLYFFLDQRLKFVEYYHATTTAVFRETKRKIETGEPPYVDMRDPETADEPAFLEEWMRAEIAMTISGATCLELVQSTFHAFLDKYMNEIGQKQLIPRLHEMGQKGWYGNYKAFFFENLQIDWASSGADLALLEQVILTRNDFTHNVDLLSLNSFQTPFHSSKYPDSAFADEEWKGVMDNVRLTVRADTLQRVLGALRTLCGYLDQERYRLLRRWRDERNGCPQ